MKTHDAGPAFRKMCKVSRYPESRMKIRPFELERWQSIWEYHVELNISESGVLPMPAAHLADDPAMLDRILALPLGYPQTNGSIELRELIAALYPRAKASNVLV